ncbi:MAG: polyphosphate kinase 1 [Gammaproteobacteria bacterium]
MDATDLKRPELYINRELSVLAFNHRVLDLAKDSSIPLLERLRFLCISSLNLDEFFEIRVAGLQQRLELAVAPLSPDDMAVGETLRAIREQATDLIAEQYRVLNDQLLPALANERIYIVRRDRWSSAQEAWIRRYFNDELLAILSPLGLDPAHPFPRILNKSLNFIVPLQGKDAFGRHSGMAIVQAPRSLSRVIQVPASDARNHEFVLLSSVIHAYVDELFPGMKVTGCYQFRVTRNSDLYVDEEEVVDILRAVQGELASRRYGDAVRLEVSDDCPDDTVIFLQKQFELGNDDVYAVHGPVNLNRLEQVYGLVNNRPELKFPAFVPHIPKSIAKSADLFETLRNTDVLLNHPYDSFMPVLDFVRQAASDPKVLAIKQTLYRTGPDSNVVDALVSAAQAGKEVSVVIELRARFDEADNIALANKLQEAGAHVVYGIVGYKTHAKMILVVRREGRGLRRYVHLGTGNYHMRTSTQYTDYSLMTSNPEIGEDVNRIFLQLTSLGKVMKLHKLKQSPFTLYSSMLECIDNEAKHAQAGKRAHIIVKVNALTEPGIIQALYKAAITGVRIDLIVRGICCLRPGIPGISKNIHVRSIVGRFLEHTRVFYFYNGGKKDVYCSSADWMERNFFRRVEVCFPVLQKKHRDRIIKDLKKYLKDNTRTWVLQPDGRYRRLKPRKKGAYKAQLALREQYRERSPL